MVVNLNFNSAFLRFYNIEKLEINVLSKTSLYWVNSYLKMQKQAVSVNWIFSIFPV